jgi:hypothetical protein
VIVLPAAETGNASASRASRINRRRPHGTHQGWENLRRAISRTRLDEDVFAATGVHNLELEGVLLEVRGNRVYIIALSKLGKRYESGLHRVGDTYLYVNRGIGMDSIGPRVRFFARPEITVIEVQSTNRVKSPP